MNAQKAPSNLAVLLSMLLVLLPVFTGNSAGTNAAVLMSAEGKVENQTAGNVSWRPAVVNQILKVKDGLRTGWKSQAAVRLSDLSILRLNQLTTIQIQPPGPTNKNTVLDIQRGIGYLYNREQPGETEFRTPLASGAIRGTEFIIEVAAEGVTTVTLIDGIVELSNDLGSISLKSGEQGLVEPGQAPRRTAVLNAINLVQWALYYPGVVDSAEIARLGNVSAPWAGAFEAYQRGALLDAAILLPTNTIPATLGEVYLQKAVLLGVGEMAGPATLSEGVSPPNELAASVERGMKYVRAAVLHQPMALSTVGSSASEWLGLSYYQQSQGELKKALESAEKAVALSPQFGFAWVRVAELEFGFGRGRQAKEALEKSLRLSPANAQAQALSGFMLAAENRMSESRTAFQKAIELDPGLGNGWLGLGLCQIRQGEVEAGRVHLQMAAAMEPNQAIFRSYAGKAFHLEGRPDLAEKEIQLGKKLDPNDPTSWFYLALLKQDQNKLNQAVRELERSVELNKNRSVFRSKLLLDQDRAVRGANLASIYRDNGMFDVSLWEASKSVSADYANASAHLFLANSYDNLRDPRQLNLRYETPWQSELLIANLLSPVGVGTLSQNISQQEYSQLFERNRLGVSSSTEYFSSGDWVQRASQYGYLGNSSYAVDVDYRSENGQRPNSDFERMTLYGKFKQQLTPQDTLFLQMTYSQLESGDVSQYYDQLSATVSGSNQRVRERLEPVLMAGLHHEWQPGVHTLFLSSFFSDTFFRDDSQAAGRVISLDAGGNVMGVTDFPGKGTRPFQLDYRRELEGFSGELQQIFQFEKHSTIAGVRYQIANVDAISILSRSASFPPIFSNPPASQTFASEIQRISGYVYHNWQVLEPLVLSAGLTYDDLTYPANFEDPPLGLGENSRTQLSPKAGFTWQVSKRTALRGLYSQSLGGVFFDTSVRLEPTQVSGLNQAYRSLVPESIVGLVPGSRFETFGFALDHRTKFGTYLGVEGEMLRSEATQNRGAFLYNGTAGGNLGTRAYPVIVPTDLSFVEKSLYLTVNQLLSDEWSVGGRFRLTHAELETRSPSLPAGGVSSAGQPFNRDEAAVLPQLNLFAIYNHASGFFGQLFGTWTSQSNHGYVRDLPGDDFWQFHAFLGYRFLKRRMEIRTGILNLADQNYQLTPLSLYSELPRERTFTVSLKFNF